MEKKFDMAAPPVDPVEKQRAKEIPVSRCNRDDINRLMNLFAVDSELHKTKEQMEHRIRSIPNGWRNFRLIESLYGKFLADLLLTVPAEKLTSLKRMLPGMLYKAYYAKPASVDKEETLILTDELNVLCEYAHEHCQFCDRTNCSQCDLGKTFDSILTDDRDGGCWSTIDIFGHEEV